jgi:mono/diheme cytochrome c family protein
MRWFSRARILFLVISLSSASLCLGDNSTALLIEQGKGIFKTHTCTACHGDAGKGTVAAPGLIGMAKRRSPEALAELLHHRSKEMKHGGMPPVSVSEQEMAALVAYVRSL